MFLSIFWVACIVLSYPVVGRESAWPTSVSKVFSDKRNSDDWNTAPAKSKQLLFDIGNASDDAMRIWHVGATVATASGTAPPLQYQQPRSHDRVMAQVIAREGSPHFPESATDNATTDG
jgi:hypothetical protein